MKKRSILIICLMILTLVFAGCGADASGKTEGGSKNTEEAATIFNNIWALYGEADLFPVLGGDLANMVSDAPGKFDLSDADGLTYQLYIPATDVDMIEDAASAMHAMNSNTFTGCVIKLRNGVDKNKFAADLKANIDSTQWVCGSPEKLIIASTSDNDIIYGFGAADIIDSFKDKLMKAYPSAKAIYEEDIVLGF